MRRHVVDVHVPALAPVLLCAYDLATFEAAERPHERRTRPPGQPPRTNAWALDLRIPLLKGEILAPIARELADGLVRAGVFQVAGSGFGAYGLVGAVVAADGQLRGGLIRPEPKGHGFHEQVEGALRPDAPVALVDDLLSSGSTSLAAADLLARNGLRVTEVHTVFALAFRRGAAALGAVGIAHRCLASLHPAAGFQNPRELTV